MVMLGGTQGSTHHAVVPPHCAESSSVASLPCGHSSEIETEKRKGRKQGRKGGMREKEVIVADLGWTEDMSPLFSSPRENILTK